MKTKRRVKKKKSFDWLNFAYGFGAAIVLTAAMFKFLGWEYANELFLVGLTTEAFVFLISGFEYRSSQISYKWERVFPQLKETRGTDQEKIDISETLEVYHKTTNTLIDSVNVLNDTIEKLGTAANSLNTSVDGLNKKVERLDNSYEEYDNELNDLKQKLKKVNIFYRDMSYIIGKDPGGASLTERK